MVLLPIDLLIRHLAQYLKTQHLILQLLHSIIPILHLCFMLLLLDLLLNQ
jgi:hypothetical protein